jgi:hypothetical protein
MVKALVHYMRVKLERTYKVLPSGRRALPTIIGPGPNVIKLFCP